MLGTTRLAMCVKNIDKCSFMRVYSVWKKTYWKKGIKYNDRHWIVLDNTSMARYRFDNKQFDEHFEIIDEKTIKPNLWKRIQKKRKTH
jgi:hypothetical protein